MSLVRVVIQRTFKWTAVSLKQREYIDMTPEKQHPTPRLQRAPSTQIKNLKGVETTVQHREPVMKHEIAPQCPWCKTTTIGGLKAIVCPVWPSHSVVEMVNTPSTAKEDEFRGADLSRMPVDVFRVDRYFNEKAFLAAKDPYRMTTPVSHKIDGWLAKYGTKE